MLAPILLLLSSSPAVGTTLNYQTKTPLYVVQPPSAFAKEQDGLALVAERVLNAHAEFAVQSWSTMPAACKGARGQDAACTEALRLQLTETSPKSGSAFVLLGGVVEQVSGVQAQLTLHAFKQIPETKTWRSVESASETTRDAGRDGWLDSFVRKATTTEFSKLLARHVRSGASGAVELVNVREGATLTLGDAEFENLPAGTLRVEGVPEGPKPLRLERPGLADFESSVDVAPNETLVYGLNDRDSNSVVARRVVLGTGISATALAAAMAITAVALPASGVPEQGVLDGCYQVGPRSNRYRWARLGGGGMCSNAGLPLIPVGAGLLTAGLGTIAATLLTDDDHVPWLATTLSFLAGVGVTAAILAVEPPASSNIVSVSN